MYEKPNDTTWNVVKSLIDERRANGLPDFIPQPNGPVPPPIDHSLPNELINHLKEGITIPNMVGTMTNFNYPEDFELMFNLNTEITLFGDLQNDSMRYISIFINNYLNFFISFIGLSTSKQP